MQVVNTSAVKLDWVNRAGPVRAAGSERVTGYAVNFALVGPDPRDPRPQSGVFQLPIYGSLPSVAIPILRPGQRYVFQVG